MNISEMSERTGLSRNTLSALQNNTGKGIQFDTMDAICKLLDITPCELFTYADINASIFSHPNKNQIRKNEEFGYLETVNYSSFYELEIFYNESRITFQGLLNTSQYPDHSYIVFSVKVKSILEKIPLIFRQEIYNSIIECAINELNNSYDLPTKIDKKSLGIKFLEDDYITNEIREFIKQQDGELDEFLEK
ncbi:hypothetical protein J42TS3_42300 [Paenibacillus vini]|uniref:HTH cro/C1-type domain-containing protein n=2 Tax=Paenibacillus vini TaxID=1476024 RepID=A0ABQ4MIH0_9BACL|nr:hypothetical protein J42TS3_42300 [Paenibacillus vini]